MKKSLFIASSILLAAGFTACQEDIDFNNAGVNLTQYQFKEAKDIWKGSDVNVVCTYDSDTEGVQDTTMTLTLAMYQEKTPEAGVTLDLVVNTDTLNQAIQNALTDEGNTYTIYSGAQILPSQFYTLSASTISAGSPASVTVKRQALIDYVAQNRTTGTFVLPVSMKSSQYKVNSVLGTMMYIYQVGYNNKEYYIAEADGTDLRQVVTSDNAQNYDTYLTLALPSGQRVSSDAEFDIIVDTDSLNNAIAKAYSDDNFSAFRHAELLPSQYYALASNKLSTEPVKLTLKYGDLAATVKSSGQSARYVLPITIKSANDLTNTEKATVMYNVTIINLDGDDTKVDPSAAPQTLDNGRSLVWSDEFNTTGSYDASMWVPENGFCRNNEAQWYQGENAEVKDGALVITAKKERKANTNYNAGSSDWKLNREYAEYTSASLVSNFCFNRGTLICRAKLPCKSGTWPAIWTTGYYSGWPSGAWEWPYGGEIDIMEYYPNHSTGLPSIHANVCWGSDTRWSGNWDSMNVPTDSFDELDWDYKYHVWRMDWDMSYIKLYCDDQLINTIDLSNTWNGSGSWWSEAWNSGAWRNPFTDHDWNPCYQQIFLNLALGGDNGGTIDDASTPFEYFVDYIRVYQNPDAEGGYEVNMMK